MEMNSDFLLTFLLNASWQLAVVAALAALADRVLRNGPARYRHLIWAAALLAAILLPSYSARRPAVTASIAVNMPEAAVASDTPPLSSKVESAPIRVAPTSVRFSENAGVLMAIAYFLLLAYAVCRLGRAWWNTLSIRAATDAPAPPDSLARVWAFCTKTFGLGRGVLLLRSEAVPSPVALGVVRPAVIVPGHLWHESSEDLLTAAIGHELAHIARRDFMTNLAYEVLFAFIAFHPAAWYIRRQLERTREMACDEAVTTLLLTPHTYARSILQIAATIAQTASPGYTLGIFEGGALEDRMRRLLQKSIISVRRARVFFAIALTSLAVVAVLASGLALTARAQSAFHTQIQQGIAAYNTGDFRTASSYFTTAVSMEPADTTAKLYLANSLMSEFYAQNQPDLRLRASAMQQYTDVLARDPKNKQALAGLATITMEARQLREAHEWAAKLTSVDPNDKTAWYTLGVLDWMAVYPEYQRARQAAGGAPEQYAIPDSNLRRAFREQYLPQVEQGMQMLHKALALDARYDAAMAYMNLLLRIKAAAVDDPAEGTGLIAEADKWIGRALEAKRSNPKPPPPESAKLDLNGPPPGPARHTTMMKAPPPPPPPPPPGREKQIASPLPRPNAVPNQPPLVGEYWQVVGANDMPAIALYRQLRERKFEAVLHAGSDGLTRVLAGPYFDNQSASKVKTDLEAAGFRVLRKWE